MCDFCVPISVPSPEDVVSGVEELGEDAAGNIAESAEFVWSHKGAFAEGTAAVICVASVGACIPFTVIAAVAASDQNYEESGCVACGSFLAREGVTVGATAVAGAPAWIYEGVGAAGSLDGLSASGQILLKSPGGAASLLGTLIVEPNGQEYLLGGETTS
jgi:hypothetical protein